MKGMKCDGYEGMVFRADIILGIHGLQPALFCFNSRAWRKISAVWSTCCCRRALERRRLTFYNYRTYLVDEQ